MRWSRPLTGLVVLALVGLTVGALWQLTAILGESAAVTTLGVVVLALVLGIVAGTRGSDGPTNPYW